MKFTGLLLCLVIMCQKPTGNNGYHQIILGELKKWVSSCGSGQYGSDHGWDTLLSSLMTNQDLDRGQKCFLFCLSNRMGIQDANGKFLRDDVIMGIEQIVPIFHMKESFGFGNIMKPIIDCFYRVPENNEQCETAGEIIKCFREQYNDFMGLFSNLKSKLMHSGRSKKNHRHSHKKKKRGHIYGYNERPYHGTASGGYHG